MEASKDQEQCKGIYLLWEPLSGLPKGRESMIVAMPFHVIVMARYEMPNQPVQS